MNLRRLRIDKFDHFQVLNFPDQYQLDIETSTNGIQVVIYYVDEIEDIQKFLEYNSSANLPEDNRTILMYKKGRKDGVNRDSIMIPFKEGKYPDYKLKAPMLCSISEDLSAIVLMKVN